MNSKRLYHLLTLATVHLAMLIPANARAQSDRADTVTVCTLTADSLRIETVVTTTTVTRTTHSMPRSKTTTPTTQYTVSQPQTTIISQQQQMIDPAAQLAIDNAVDSITDQYLYPTDLPEATVETGTIPAFSRAIENVSFVPKGQWITGVSVSYSQSNQNNYQFLILQGVNGDTYSFKVSPMLMYAFKDNLAVGGRFSYTRSRTNLQNASVVLDSETSYDVDHLYMISHSYHGTAAFRNYLSLGNQTRFGLFNEVQIEIGGGQSIIENGTGLDYTGTYSRNFNVGVGLAPGLVMFLNNYSAIEVNVGVLGFDYKHNHSVTDQIYVSDIRTKSANFRVNLFSIMFGCTFYI